MPGFRDWCRDAGPQQQRLGDDQGLIYVRSSCKTITTAFWSGRQPSGLELHRPES